MFDFPNLKKGAVGVKLSGGADSSIIYYALCEKYKNTDVHIIPVTLDTTLKPWYVLTAKKVIAKVGDLTGKYPLEHITDKVDHSMENYIKGQDQLLNRAISKYNIDPDHFYSGLTYNPDITNMRTYFNENAAKHGLDISDVWKELNERPKDRDFNQTKRVLSVAPLKDKLATAEAYKFYDVIDTLYPITYSCESTYKKRLKDLKHCGKCFFCLERWYAFGRII